MFLVPNSAPAHQPSFSVNPVPGRRHSVDAATATLASRRTPRLRVLTSALPNTTENIIAESDEVPSSPPCAGQWPSTRTGHGSTSQLDTAAAHHDLADDEAEGADDGRDADEDEVDEEPIMTPMPRRRTTSPVEGRHASLSAGILPSQMGAAQRRQQSMLPLARALPSRQGLVFGGPGARISVVRDERKALGLQAAVGNFRKRATSNSSTDRPTPSHDSSSSPTSLSSPETPESPLEYHCEDSHSFPAAKTPQTAVVGGSQTEARRRALARVAQGAGHRRISSDHLDMANHGGRSDSGASNVTSSRSMPSLDQIRGWAAQRKTTATPMNSIAKSMTRPTSHPPTSRTFTDFKSSRPSPPQWTQCAPVPLPTAAVREINTSHSPDTVSRGNDSQGATHPNPASASSTPTLTPSSPRTADLNMPQTPSAIASVHLTNKAPGWSTASFTKFESDNIPTRTQSAPTRIDTQGLVPSIRVDPASAIQAGEGAVRFAQLVLGPSKQSSGPSRETSSGGAERAEKRRTLLGNLAEAQKRRSMTITSRSSSSTSTTTLASSRAVTAS